MKKAKKRISSGTKILKALTKNDKMKSLELRQIAFDNKTDASYYNGKVKKVPQGWWCVGISELRNGGMMEQDDNGLYSITELGKLNIDKPFTKNPLMTPKMYQAEIERWRSNYIDTLDVKRGYLCDLEEEQESNGELLKKNAELISENETLKSELDKYKLTEEVDYLRRLSTLDFEVDSYGVGILNRVEDRLRRLEK